MNTLVKDFIGANYDNVLAPEYLFVVQQHALSDSDSSDEGNCGQGAGIVPQ